MEKTNYYRIIRFFDRERKVDGIIQDPLWEFCCKLGKEKGEGKEENLERFFESKDSDSLPAGIYEAIESLHSTYLNIGFAVGYVLGQEYDIGDQDVLRIVNLLKERILKEKILPYTPRIKRQKEEPRPSTAK